MRFLSILSLAFASLVSAAIPADEVTSLPGWSDALPSRQYSGYISVDDTNGRNLHYWFVERETDPATAPLVLWLNGGPGCSSLDGYLYEHGPFHFDANARNATAPQLVYNPYTWAKLANVVFVEAPAGVGYSYSKTKSDYNTNDEKTAADNYEFVQRFLAAYPEYNTTLFITGESYAGVYVPTLADAIRKGNAAGNPFVPLEGIAVGNGCTGNEVGVCGNNGASYNVEYLFGHDLFSPPTYSTIQKTCNGFKQPLSLQCDLALAQMSKEIGNVNIYNIYDDCINGGYDSSLSSSSNSIRRPFPARSPLASKLGGPVECIDGQAAYNYLNQDDVRAALHVASAAVTGEWVICSSQINYDSTVANLPRDTYPTLIQNYRVLIFNGDADACVPYTDNYGWTSGMGYKTKQPWRSWTTTDEFGNQQVAGFVTVYDTPNDFTFLTVKGAGHMVPQYKPQQAFAMLQRFLANQPF